jgi:hypothetical protein
MIPLFTVHHRELDDPSGEESLMSTPKNKIMAFTTVMVAFMIGTAVIMAAAAGKSGTSATLPLV